MIWNLILHLGQMNQSPAIQELIDKSILWQSSCIYVPLKTSFPLVQVFKWPGAFNTSIYSNLRGLSLDGRRHHWTECSQRQEHVQAILAHPTIYDGEWNKMRASFHVVTLCLSYTIYPMKNAHSLEGFHSVTPFVDINSSLHHIFTHIFQVFFLALWQLYNWY